jgi:hypothetical protein
MSSFFGRSSSFLFHVFFLFLSKKKRIFFKFNGVRKKKVDFHRFSVTFFFSLVFAFFYSAENKLLFLIFNGARIPVQMEREIHRQDSEQQTMVRKFTQERLIGCRTCPGSRESRGVALTMTIFINLLVVFLKLI